MVIGRCRRSGADEARVRAVFDVRISVAEDRTIAKMSKLSPAVQNDCTVEWLSFRSDNDAIVIAPIPGIRLAPMPLEAGEFQSIETADQFLCPLEPVTAFSDVPIHQERTENARSQP